MSKGFSDRLKEQVERLEECSKEFSEAIADIEAEIDEGCIDLDLDDLPDIIRELKWLAEDIEKAM